MQKEPSDQITDVKALLLGQLSYLRGAIAAKLAGLTADQLTHSAVPSGWTPLGLLNHVVHVERRWMRWGFGGEALPEPWADHDPGGGWLTPTDGDAHAQLKALLSDLDAGARVTERLAETSGIDARARLGGRFSSDPPTLGWILLHLVEEFGRHAGHLDIARELIDGVVGE